MNTHTVHWCACSNVAVGRDGTGWFCQSCRDLEVREYIDDRRKTPDEIRYHDMLRKRNRAEVNGSGSSSPDADRYTTTVRVEVKRQTFEEHMTELNFTPVLIAFGIARKT